MKKLIKYWVLVPLIGVSIFAVLAQFKWILKGWLDSFALVVIAWTFFIIYWDIKARNRPYIYVEESTVTLKPVSHSENQLYLDVIIINRGPLHGTITNLTVRCSIDGVSSELPIPGNLPLDLFPNQSFKLDIPIANTRTQETRFNIDIDYKTPAKENKSSYGQWFIDWEVRKIILLKSIAN